MRCKSILSSIFVVLFAAGTFGSPAALAQGADPGLKVVGTGQASAPADSASIQIVVGDSSYAPPPVPDPDAVPGAEQRAALDPVVTALVDAGVPEADIVVLVPPYIQDVYGYGGPALGVLQMEVSDPAPERLTELVDAAALGAAQERLIVSGVTVLYGVEDCESLLRAAREAAIADARQQAEVQAELLDVTVGDLVASSDLPAGLESAYWYGAFPPNGDCSPFASAASLFLPGGIGGFDPTGPAEVTVYAIVELSFAFSSEGAATPAA